MENIVIYFDEDSEMYKIEVDGKCIKEENYWDFSVTDLPDLLTVLRISVEEKTYNYEDEVED